MVEDGIVDNEELAMAYLDATVGLSENAPAANRERRRTYVVEASQMLEFLIGRGIRFQRLRNYPDYYDERPGGLSDGRVVVAKLFDISRLGPWADKRSEEHTSELQSLMRISYAVFCLKKKTN